MPTFVTSLTLKLDIDAEDVHDANKKLHQCRQTIMEALHDHLAADGILRVRIPAPISQPFKEFVEVDEAWLENDKLRGKFQLEWDYETREVPVVPGSKLTLTHKVAIGPKDRPVDTDGE